MKKKVEWYVSRTLKPPKTFFDWCLSHLPVYQWSNKEKTILSSERKSTNVIKKRLTKNSKLTFDAGYKVFTIILSTSKRIEIQSYVYWQEFNDGIEQIESELINLELMEKNEYITIGKYSYMGQYGFGLVNITPMGGKYTGAKLYQNNWMDKIQNESELKYLDFSTLFNDLEEFEQKQNYFRWLSHYYRWRTEIEFLQKINAEKIAKQLACNQGIDYRTVTKKWLRDNKNLLKNSMDDFFDFEFKRRIHLRKGKAMPGIQEYMNYHDLRCISSQVGIISFQNWVIKNKVDMKYYRDYLSLLKDLKIKVDNRNLIMPKDLVAAHDNAVKLLNELQREIDNRTLAKRMKSLAKLEKNIGGYCFMVPKDLNELVVEGKQLHHCVGGSTYVEGHRNGKTTIIFVRQAKQPDKPFYTLEFKNGKIVQLRGKHNKKPTQDIEKVADEWLQAVTSKVS